MERFFDVDSVTVVDDNLYIKCQQQGDLVIIEKAWSDQYAKSIVFGYLNREMLNHVEHNDMSSYDVNSVTVPDREVALANCWYDHHKRKTGNGPFVILYVKFNKEWGVQTYSRFSNGNHGGAGHCTRDFFKMIVWLLKKHKVRVYLHHDDHIARSALEAMGCTVDTFAARLKYCNKIEQRWGIRFKQDRDIISRMTR